MKRSVAIVSFFVATCQLANLRSQASGEERAPQQQISVEEIGKSVVLVGRLGVPLGEKMEISGYWHFPAKPNAKDSSIRFTVTIVNGKKLAQPVEFNHGQLDFSNREHRNVIPDFKAHRELDGQTWTLIAYETGSIQITPDEYRDKSPVFPVVGMPYYTRPFTSQLVGVVKRKQGRTGR
jgi:hypothetical protein